MQQLETYKLKHIGRDDAFGPDALNANTDAIAEQLARIDAAVSAETAARESAAAAEKSRVDAALGTKAPQTEITRLETTLSAETAARTADTARLEKAIGTGGTNARFVTGTYTGKDAYGPSNKNSLDFSTTLGRAPKLLIVVDGTYGHTLTAVNGAGGAMPTAEGGLLGIKCYFTWTSTGVSWYGERSAELQMNLNRTYYYVAFA